MSIPAGWEVMSLGDLMGSELFTDGDWIESKDQDPGGGVRLIQLADIGEGLFRDRSSRFVNHGTVERLNCTLLAAGDVLVARMPDPLGRACLVPSTLGMPAITAVDVCVLRPDASRIHAPWLMWAINTPDPRSQIAALQTGTTRKRISRKNLATVRLPVPSLPEQKRIVEAIEEQFSRLDAAEASLVSARQRAKRLRASALSRLTSGTLTPLGEVLAEGMANGHSVPTNDNGFPVLRLSALSSGEVDLAERKGGDWTRAQAERYLVRAGDFLIARGNGSLRLVGRGGLVEEDDEVAFPDTMIRVRPDKTRISPRYLRLVWDSAGVRRQIERAARTTAGIYKINQQDLKRVLVPCPSLEEQDEAVAEGERLASSISHVDSEVSLASARACGLRLAILSHALSGQLVPRRDSVVHEEVLA